MTVYWYTINRQGPKYSLGWHESGSEKSADFDSFPSMLHYLLDNTEEKSIRIN